MTQLSVMDLAKQGDPHAIAALINRSLASKGIHAEAELEAECLKISLQATQVPNQKAVVTIIHRGMIVLQVKQIKRVKILTYRSDNHYLAWQHEIDLEQNLDDEPKQSLPKPPIAKDTNVEQGQNMDLVSNPKGVILVQKLSQIQQNLQEYQDIIVRFTDEQVGTVRCLTTLTELIQVISQPSFLFAAVASNPNLRSLLDTIAESSKTDQHGDQVITNLSILQPGQQWQKAKIRLVTKIFLEPADLVQDQDEPEVPHQGITLDLAESKPEPITDNDPELDLASLRPEIPPDHSPNSIDNLDSDSNLAPVTTDSLFDDFPETSSPRFEENQPISESSLDNNLDSITASSLFDDFPETSSPRFEENQSILESSLDNNVDLITASSLFDDFPETSRSSSQPVQIVNDITENSDFSDSLFDDFMNVDSANSYRESENLSIDQVKQETNSANTDDDLFDNFSSSDRTAVASIESDITELESDIEAIKSRIPKQNLDKLLQLMDEEEQTGQSQAINNALEKDKIKLGSDLGATTIERILGNMETISLNGSDSKSASQTASNFVTLEDFSEDLNSIGF
jgi:hypothetical protein